MTTFINTADSRNTSAELLDAMLYIANGDETVADRIWQDPTEAEIIAIYERVTKNGLIDPAEFKWGACGTGWAQ